MQRHVDEHSTETFEQKQERVRRLLAGVSVPPATQPKVKHEFVKKAAVTPVATKPVETPKSNTHLNASIQEFYSANRKFHAEMADLIEQLFKLMPDVPEDRRAHVRELMEPYLKLAENPFSSEPTGHLETDLTHIFTVANSKNERFRLALQALQNSVANLSDFKSEIEKLKADKKFAKRIQEVAGGNLRMQGKVDMPFQHLVRYELLLVAIKKELSNAGYELTDEALSMVMQSIENIVPEVININEYSEVFAMLNRVERVIYALCGLEGQRVMLEGTLGRQAKEKHDMLLTIHDVVQNGKDYIARGGDEIHQLLSGLLSMLHELEKKYSVLVGSWSDYAYSTLTMPATFFAGTRTAEKNNPVNELREIVEQLKLTVGIAKMFSQSKERMVKQ